MSDPVSPNRLNVAAPVFTPQPSPNRLSVLAKEFTPQSSPDKKKSNDDVYPHSVSTIFNNVFSDTDDSFEAQLELYASVRGSVKTLGKAYEKFQEEFFQNPGDLNLWSRLKAVVKRHFTTSDSLLLEKFAKGVMKEAAARGNIEILTSILDLSDLNSDEIQTTQALLEAWKGNTERPLELYYEFIKKIESKRFAKDSSYHQLIQFIQDTGSYETALSLINNPILRFKNQNWHQVLTLIDLCGTPFKEFEEFYQNYLSETLDEERFKLHFLYIQILLSNQMFDQARGVSSSVDEEMIAKGSEQYIRIFCLKIKIEALAKCKDGIDSLYEEFISNANLSKKKYRNDVRHIFAIAYEFIGELFDAEKTLDETPEKNWHDHLAKIHFLKRQKRGVEALRYSMAVFNECRQKGMFWRTFIWLASYYSAATEEDMAALFEMICREVPKTGEVLYAYARYLFDFCLPKAIEQEADKIKDEIRDSLAKAIKMTPQFGDSFILQVQLEVVEKGTDADLSVIERDCLYYRPNYGTLWEMHKKHPEEARALTIRNAKEALLGEAFKRTDEQFWAILSEGLKI